MRVLARYSVAISDVTISAPYPDRFGGAARHRHAIRRWLFCFDSDAANTGRSVFASHFAHFCSVPVLIPQLAGITLPRGVMLTSRLIEAAGPSAGTAVNVMIALHLLPLMDAAFGYRGDLRTADFGCRISPIYASARLRQYHFARLRFCG